MFLRNALLSVSMMDLSKLTLGPLCGLFILHIEKQSNWLAFYFSFYNVRVVGACKMIRWRFFSLSLSCILEVLKKPFVNILAGTVFGLNFSIF